MPVHRVALTDERGRRRSVASALTAEYSVAGYSVLAADASIAQGRAYLAVLGPDGEVRPVFLALESELGEHGRVLLYRPYPPHEYPTRWPNRIAALLTTREPRGWSRREPDRG